MSTAAIAMRTEAWKATASRVQSERELVYGFKLEPPPVPDPKRQPGLSPEENLVAREKRHTRAAEAWFLWRDSAPNDQVLAARKGLGPGASLCAEFRASRAWVQEASKELQTYRQLDRRLENAQRP